MQQSRSSGSLAAPVALPSTCCPVCSSPLAFQGQLAVQCPVCRQMVSNPAAASSSSSLSPAPRPLLSLSQAQLAPQLQPQPAFNFQQQQALQEWQVLLERQQAAGGGGGGGSTGFVSAGVRLVQCPACAAVVSFLASPSSVHCPQCAAWIDVSAASSLSASPLTSSSTSPFPSPPSSGLSSPVSLSSPQLQSPTSPTTASASSSSSSSSSNKKKRKDTSAPKRAANAYMLFCQQQRAAVHDADPQLAFGSLGQRLGAIWRSMSAEEKQPFELRASVDRRRYKQEMVSYQAEQMRRQMGSQLMATAAAFRAQQQQQQQQMTEDRPKFEPASGVWQPQSQPPPSTQLQQLQQPQQPLYPFSPLQPTPLQPPHLQLMPAPLHSRSSSLPSFVSSPAVAAALPSVQPLSLPAPSLMNSLLALNSQLAFPPTMASSAMFSAPASSASSSSSSFSSLSFPVLPPPSMPSGPSSLRTSQPSASSLFKPSNR